MIVVMLNRQLLKFLVLVVISVGGVLGGCQSMSPSELVSAQASFRQSDYARALDQAVKLSHSADPAVRMEASYLAGLAARQQGKPQLAAQYLQAVTKNTDCQMAADIAAELGLIYRQQQRYNLAVRQLLVAAKNLEGQHRANAYYYAAEAQKKLGRWAEARTSLSLARASSNDLSFRQRIDEQLDVTGWTIQVGAFEQQSNAQSKAKSVATQGQGANLGPARIVPSIDVNGRKLYLVQIGQFSTFVTAKTARNRLKASQGSIIVPLARGL